VVLITAEKKRCSRDHIGMLGATPKSSRKELASDAPAIARM
jgi:hypothetical protein